MTRSLLVILSLLCTVVVAQAQTDPIRLTLPEAIERGLEASHRLAELSAREDAARAVERQRGSALLPQVALNASFARTNHIEEFGVPNATGGIRILYPDIPNVSRSRMELQWPIYSGGRLEALTKAAGADVDASAQDREAARADLKLEITRAYWAVITARASEEVVTQALERTNAHLVDVRNQLSVGLVPPSDVLSIEAQQAHQQMLRIEAENLVETSSADFRRLVGLQSDAPFELVDALLTTDPRYRTAPPAQPRAASPSGRVAVETARTSRPERKALEFRIQAAADRVAAASAGSLPVLTAIGGYDYARPNARIFPLTNTWRSSWDLGVQLRWSLFDGGRVGAEVAEASANLRATEARMRDFDSGIELEVRQRTADLRAAQASIAAAQTGVQAAAEARRVLAERFAAGVATNTDVLTAQVTLLQAELDLTRAIAGARLAEARLDRAIGR